MWNKVKSIKGVQKSTDIKLLRTNNNKSIITEPLEIANALGEYFQEISDDNNFDPNFIKYKSEIEKQNINVKELTTVEHIDTPNLNLTITRKELLFMNIRATVVDLMTSPSYLYKIYPK